jgi:hypothetical protein
MVISPACVAAKRQRPVRPDCSRSHILTTDHVVSRLDRARSHRPDQHGRRCRGGGQIPSLTCREVRRTLNADQRSGLVSLGQRLCLKRTPPRGQVNLSRKAEVGSHGSCRLLSALSRRRGSIQHWPLPLSKACSAHWMCYYGQASVSDEGAVKVDASAAREASSTIS